MKLKFNNLTYGLSVSHLSSIKKHIYNLVTNQLNWFLVKDYDLQKEGLDVWELIIYDVASKEIANKYSHELDCWDSSIVQRFLECGCKESNQLELLDLTGVYGIFADECARYKLREIMEGGL